MSSANSPFGFVPVRAVKPPRAYTILTGYAVTLCKGDPVKLTDTVGGAGSIDLAVTDGTRSGTASGVPVLGIFMGCEYIDSSGKPTYSPYWPASTAATEIVAWVQEAWGAEFLVQADGAVAALDVGSQTDLTGFASAGSTITGISAATVSATPIADDSQGQFTILEIDRAPGNAAADSYTRLIVQIANPQLGQSARTAQNAAGT